MEKNRNQQHSAWNQIKFWLKPAGKQSKVAESCWLVLTLVLFVIMGPFAAPVALFAVLSLPSEQRGESEPELLSEPVRYQFH